MRDPAPLPAVAPPALAPDLAPDLTADLTALAERAAGYAARASGPGTLAAYASAWRGYAAWCAGSGRDPLSGDPALVALYLTRRAEDGLAVSSLQVARAAIRRAHRLAGIPLDLADPRLAMVLEGITRSHGTRPRRRAAAAVPELLRRLLAALPGPAAPAAAAPALAARNRAMLLLGCGAALRRSELVALRLGDVTAVAERGLTVLVRRGKTDQHGAGKTLAVCANPAEPGFCPLVAVQRWLAIRQAASDRPPPSPTSPAVATERPLFCGITASGRCPI
jgi:hypothetical protein